MIRLFHLVVALLPYTFVAFGVLTLEANNRVKDRTRYEARKPGVAEALRSFFKHMQALGNVDLQWVAYSGLNAADGVIANVACSLYVLYIEKPQASAVDVWFKGSDHATVAAAAADVSVILRAAVLTKRFCLVFHDGLPLSTGLTLGAHTTAAGNTKSAAADAPIGFAIVGA